VEKKNILTRIARFFKAIYVKLFRINDTPQKIAIGLGLGVFLGTLPGTGPVAALLLAVILKVNKASALLGSLATNTWISIPTFILAGKMGAAATGVSYESMRSDWALFTKSFNWSNFFNLSAYKIILPILIGYFIVSLLFGLIAYLSAIIVIKSRKKKAGQFTA